MSKHFVQQLESAIKEGSEKEKQRKNDSGIKNSPVKISIIDKIHGIKGAFKRIKDKSFKEGLDSVWIDEKEAIERQICCTTCTDGTSCPYCGCQIKKSWFLPLGKSELTTEGCPNPTTYPHLKKFPPKNYWKVCLEKTSILIPSRNEKYLVNTIKNLLETSTGDIEILVGIDGKTNFDYFVDDHRVIYIKYDNPVGKRYILNELAAISNGKYLFRIDAHCIMNYGWDTKLKCLCDNDTIISSSISEINEEKWELNEITYNSLYFDKNLETYWGANQVDKINNIMCFYPSGWMITKDTFNKFNGYNENLGQYVNEEIEWSLNILLYGGKILNRSDVICSHLFRDEFPYLMNDDIFKSKEILNKIWKDDSVFKKIRIEDIFPIFSNTSFEKT